jgi:hypothetical protein
MTTKETLDFYASVILPSNWPKAKKNERVVEVLDAVGLGHGHKTLVSAGGMGGGQRVHGPQTSCAAAASRTNFKHDAPSAAAVSIWAGMAAGDEIRHCSAVSPCSATCACHMRHPQELLC